METETRGRLVTWSRAAKCGSIPTSPTSPTIVRQHPLATVTGLGLVIGFLLRDGAMCQKCGSGTRAKAKRWARCKRCGERVQQGGNGDG